MKTDFGEIEIIETKENPDGGLNITFDISDEFKLNLIKNLGWNEWSDELFNEWVITVIKDILDRTENGHD